MKDNDLRENVHLSTRDRDVVLKFLEKDSKFLEQQQVMDYSLLLGIQKGIRQTPTAPNRTSFGGAGSNFEQFAQAAALDGAETFYFGIIDFLQVRRPQCLHRLLLDRWDSVPQACPFAPGNFHAVFSQLLSRAGVG